jgi:RNA polymerase sigma-70 factor (ECF subfamily)
VEAQDEWYRQAAQEFGPALVRLAQGYEIDAEKRRDLLQEIHLALWRSFANFDARCFLRAWVYRVAYNSAASYTGRQKRSRHEALVGLEDIEPISVPADADYRIALERLTELIQRLKPIDREVILTGMSARNVATKIHRIKTILARGFNEGVRHA